MKKEETELTAMEQLIDYLQEEICERRGYSASKSFEVVIHKIKSEFIKTEKEQIYQAFVAGDERGTKEIPFNCEQYYNQKYL